MNRDPDSYKIAYVEIVRVHTSYISTYHVLNVWKVKNNTSSTSSQPVSRNAPTGNMPLRQPGEPMWVESIRPATEQYTSTSGHQANRRNFGVSWELHCIQRPRVIFVTLTEQPREECRLPVTQNRPPVQV